MKEKIRTLEDINGWVLQRFDPALKMWVDVEFHPYKKEVNEKDEK